MLTGNNHLKRKHQNDGNAEDGGHAEKIRPLKKRSKDSFLCFLQDKVSQ